MNPGWIVLLPFFFIILTLSIIAIPMAILIVRDTFREDDRMFLTEDRHE